MVTKTGKMCTTKQFEEAKKINGEYHIHLMKFNGKAKLEELHKLQQTKLYPLSTKWAYECGLPKLEYGQFYGLSHEGEFVIVENGESDVNIKQVLLGVCEMFMFVVYCISTGRSKSLPDTKEVANLLNQALHLCGTTPQKVLDKVSKYAP